MVETPVLPHGAGKHGHPHGGAPTLGDVMDWFKTMTTNAYIRGVKDPGGRRFPDGFGVQLLRTGDSG